MMSIWRTLFGITSGFSVCYLLQSYSWGFTKTTGASMLPTVDEGGLILVRKNKKKVQKHLQRGDVVLCLSVENPGELVVKRVTAMEGDILPDKIQPINRYIRHSDFIHVPIGHIWLRGDNCENSTDSRYYGPVPLALVQGRVTHQVYPHLKKIHSAL